MNPTEQLPSLALSERAASAEAGRGLASEIKGLWKRGEAPDARAALWQHPELGQDKSVVLDLAYEEYCQRLEAGAPPDPDEFCERFPSFQASLRRLIEAHRFLEENSYLLAGGQPSHWPGPGERFLGFELLRELGRGAFARVFLAAEPALGRRRVAVKVSLQGASEAETLGRIEHPNIVPVHSVQEERLSGLTVVCMPYVGSATMCDVLDKVFAGGGAVPARGRAVLDAVREATPADAPAAERRPDPVLLRESYEDGIAHLGAQLADALACIHDLGICHRDLKPSNILLAADGRPMLLDFNLSFDERVADSRLGGTLPYMSPEQLLATDLESGAGPSLIDARSDLFSLGMILYELLTGAHPFGPVPLKLSSRELRQHLLARQRSRPRPVRQRNPRVPRRLARLVEQCLEYNPNDRPPSAAHLAAELRRRGTWHRTRRAVARRPRLAAAALALAAIMGLTGAYSLGLFQAPSQRAFDRGMAAYRQGDMTAAVAALTRAIEAGVRTRAAYFTRARAYQRIGKYVPAAQDFEKADEIAPQAETKAAVAYCLLLDGDYRGALPFQLRAMAAGPVAPESHNSLGLMYFMDGQLDNARVEFDRALAADPGLRAAYCNRGLVDLRRAEEPAQRFYVPERGLDDMRRAVALGADCSSCYWAARLCALVDRNGRDRHALQSLPPFGNPVGTALQLALLANAESSGDLAADMASYLRQAIELGWSPAQLKNDYFFRPYADRPDFQQLIRLPEPDSRVQLDRVADPVRD